MRVSGAAITLRPLLALEQHLVAVHGDKPRLVQLRQQAGADLGIRIADLGDQDRAQSGKRDLSRDMRRAGNVAIRESGAALAQPFDLAVHAAEFSTVEKSRQASAGTRYGVDMDARTDTLTACQVDLALTLLPAITWQEAACMLTLSGVPVEVAARVLVQPAARRALVEFLLVAV